VLAEIGGRVRASGVEERDADARLRQALGHPAAGGAGADHQNVEGLACLILLRNLHGAPRERT
jgi:hypothetical protein